MTSGDSVYDDVPPEAQSTPIEKRRTQLRDTFEQISSFPIDKLTERLAEAGRPDPELSGKLQQIIRACGELIEVAGRTVDMETLDEISGLIGEADSVLTPLRNALPQILSAHQDQTRGHINNALLLIDSGHRGTVPYLPWKQRVRLLLLSFAHEQMRGRDVVALVQNVEAQHQSAAEHLDEIAQILAKVKTAPSQWTAAKFAGEFEGAAMKHRREGWWFLIASIAVGVVAVSVVLHWPVRLDHDAGWPAFIAELLPRVAAISAASLVLALFARSYRASAHLAVANQHRANVLKTFDLLVRSAYDDKETQTVLVRAAADTIFQGGSSGYLGAPDVSLDERLFAVLRDAAAKKGTP